MTQTPTLPVSVQILSTLLFGVFGILAIIFAFQETWVAGLVVALVLGWRGGFAPGQWQQAKTVPNADDLMALTPEAKQRSSGNASFDAYKADTLNRLEQEQGKFETFLARLREAKDKSEFDTFLDERAKRVRQTKPAIPTLQEPA